MKIKKMRYSLQASIINKNESPPPPKPIPRAGLWWFNGKFPTLDELEEIWPQKNRPIIPIVFYRALVQGNATASSSSILSVIREI